MSRELRLIALDIGRTLGPRVASAERVNLSALLHLKTIGETFDGKPARAWVVRTINSLVRHHPRNSEIVRYIHELRAIVDGR